MMLITEVIRVVVTTLNAASAVATALGGRNNAVIRGTVPPGFAPPFVYVSEPTDDPVPVMESVDRLGTGTFLIHCITDSQKAVDQYALPDLIHAALNKQTLVSGSQIRFRGVVRMVTSYRESYDHLQVWHVVLEYSYTAQRT